MKRVVNIFIWTLFCLLLFPQFLFPFPDYLDKGNRVFPLELSKKDLEQSYVKKYTTQKEFFEMEKSFNSIQLYFILSEKESKYFYALQIKDDSYTNYLDENFTVKVNGKLIELIPIFSKEGLYFKIIPYFLKVGENEILIEAKNKKYLSIDEIEMFSLLDTSEEIHFTQFFSGPIIETQPATHFEQLKYDVLHYDLAIQLNMSSTNIIGVLTMTAKSLDNSLQNVPLDLNDNSGSMTVTQVDQGPSTPTLSYTLDGSEERLFITLPSPVPVDNNFTVRVFYSGVPNPSGYFGASYVRSTHNSTPIIYTFSEPYGARKWWPCKDIPDDKATMDLYIKCPNAYFPVSNGNLISTVDNGDGTSTFNWSETYQMSTYLALIACTNYSVISGTYISQDGLKTMTVAHYLYPENFDAEKGALPDTIDLIDYFSNKFCEYPFLTEKYVTASHNSGSGMEHQTCTSMPALDLVGGGYGRRNIHELSHMWFGDMITMGHFNHLWLNEGFATYCEALWQEDTYGVGDYHSYVNAWSTSDAYPIVSDSADSFSPNIVYRKGAWVLHMLRHVVGDDDFFESIGNYITNLNYVYGTALSEDLQNEFEIITGQDLSWFFNEWLYRAVRPSYNWSWGKHIEGSNNILDIYITQTQTGDPYIMPIDLLVSFSGGGSETVVIQNNLKTQEFHINLGSNSPTDVSFDPDNWILDYATEQTTTPAKPVIRSAMNVSGFGDRAQITWVANGEAYCNGYELYVSEDLTGWLLAADNTILTKTTTTYDVTGLIAGNDYYFMLRATNNSGPPSDFSDIYGCRFTTNPTKLLVVEGYDRWETQFGGVYEGIYYVGKSIDYCGVAFNTCDNDIVGATVNLSDYDAVIWVLGEESTVNETFSSSEQTLVQNYLNSGKCFFVSGAEIAWDLDHNGSTSDKNFYHNYLKATYVGDDANTHQFIGNVGTIFSDISTNSFDDGTHHSWDVVYPDRLGISDGSVACMTYVGGTADNASIQYQGTYKLVNMGFPFETIVIEDARNNVMRDILNFFGFNTAVENWELCYIY